MNMTQKYCAIVLAANLFFIGQSANAATSITGTDTLAVNLNAYLQAGTCLNTVREQWGSIISSIDFGDIYRSTFQNLGYIRTGPGRYSLRSEGCSIDKVMVTTSGSAGCDGDNYKNANSTEANNLVLRVADFSMENPDMKIFSCSASTGTFIPGDGATYYFELILYPAAGKTVDDITPGHFTTPVVFTFTYQ